MANSFQHVAVAAMFLSSVFASGARADQFSLTGAWTLQSMVFVDAETESATNDFGEHPKGYMLYTPNGYMTSLITAEGRQPVPASSDRAAELRSQLLSTMNGLAKSAVPAGAVKSNFMVSKDRLFTPFSCIDVKTARSSGLADLIVTALV